MKLFRYKTFPENKIHSFSDKIDNYLLNSIVIVALFLFVNPIFSVLFITFFSINNNYSKSLSLYLLVISFSIFFFNRKFDVGFYNDSTDDVPNYISYYLNLSTLSISDIFENFIKAPSGNEPIWHILWWFINRITNGNVNLFIFLHYFLIFFLFAKISLIIIPKYFEFLFLLILFLFPVTLYNVCHVWRQILSFEFFLLGSLIYYYKRSKTYGFILILSSIFIHVSCIYFLSIFLVFNALYTFKKNITKNNILFLILSVLIFVGLCFKIMLSLLGETFIHLANYTEEASASRDNLGIKLLFYMLITFYSFLKSGTSRFNFFLFVNIMIPLFLPFIFPSLNAIYDRYFSLALTMLSVYLFINTFKEKQKNIYITNKIIFTSILLILITSFSKLYFEYKTGIGVISYIGNFGAFKFYNGILYFLFN